MTTPTKALFIHVGARRFPVASIADASAKFCAVRDARGEGASRTPTAYLRDGAGALVGHLSYNGRVWSGTPADWGTPQSTLIYDNVI